MLYCMYILEKWMSVSVRVHYCVGVVLIMQVAGSERLCTYHVYTHGKASVEKGNEGGKGADVCRVCAGSTQYRQTNTYVVP